MDVSEILRIASQLQLSDANEAETREKVIGHVVRDVLGWSVEDYTVEEHVSEDGKSRFADYIIRLPTCAIVIEAKRVGAALLNVPYTRRTTLSGSLMAGGTGDAIRQARDYARSKSVPFAVVTNGDQWIVFPASRTDQVEFSRSSAIIFPSLKEALENDYQYFTALLSRDAVVAGSLEFELLGKHTDQFGDRRLGHFTSNRPGNAKSNPLFPLIESAVVTAFSESIVDSDPELLEKCYVNTPDRMKFDSRIGVYLRKPRPDFHKQATRPRRKKDKQALDKKLQIEKSSERPVAILVVGTVGAGKTTFLTYTRRISSKSFFEPLTSGPYPHWIYIDFRGKAPEEDALTYIVNQVRHYIIKDRFLSNWEEGIRPAYKDEIRSLRDGPLKLLGDNEERVNERIYDYINEQSRTKEYVDRLIQHAASKKPVFLVVDNIDQFESSQAESDIFSSAIAFSHRNGVNLVISLRDATFVRQKTSRSFDAFDFDPIYIDAPQITSVLSKRFFLLGELLKGHKGEFIAENGAKVSIDDLSIVSSLLTSSVLGTRVGDIIDVLATSDIRLALRMTREFLESGYTNPGRAVEAYKSGVPYVLPRHEALRSVLLGKQATYSEANSIIGNPFDSRLGRTNVQLLRLFILSGLVEMGSNEVFEVIGGDRISEELGKISVSAKDTGNALEDLNKLRFIQTRSQRDATLEANFRATRLGGYIARNLIADLTFLEAMMMDTFVADKGTWDALREISENIDRERDIIKRLRLRSERAQLFYKHMSELYEPLMQEAGRRGLPKEWCVNPLEEMKSVFERNLSKALNSAKRYYS